MMKKIIFIFLLCLFNGCKSNESEDGLINDFSKLNEISLSSKKSSIEDKTKPFSSLYRMMHVNDYLILLDNSADYSFKIVNLKTGKVSFLIKKGKGPSELATSMPYFSIDRKRKELFFTDNNKYLIYDIRELDDSIPIPKIADQIGLKNDKLFNVIKCSEKMVFGSSIQNRFGLYNLETKVLKKKYTYREGGLVEQGFFITAPKKNKIANFQMSGAVLEIIDYNKNDFSLKEKRWWESENKQVVDDKGRISVKPKVNQRIAFLQGTATDELIYVLYNGNEINRQNPSKSFESDKVYVFDWEGNPIKKHLLDRKVRAIAIDENSNKIYASSEDQDGELEIIIFEL